jgi:O-antigen biosynthesis protein
MRVGLILLTWNAADAALACLDGIAQLRRQPDHLLVVDNASADETAARIRQQFPNVTLIQNERNLGFSGGMNVGITALQRLPEPPDVVALLNQDTLLDPGWLDAIVAPFVQPKVGAVGSKILYPDGTIQHAGKYHEWPRAVAQHVGWHEVDRGQYDEPRAFKDVTFAAVALRMAALNTVGLFDEGYAPAYYEDSDLCWQLRHHGYTIWYQPSAIVTHAESLSIRDAARRSQLYNRGRLRFVLKTYAPDDIWGAFADSERAFIAKHGRSIEARALRWAYIATVSELSSVLAARNTIRPALESLDQAAATRLLIDFKRALAQSLYDRARQTIDTHNNP